MTIKQQELEMLAQLQRLASEMRYNQSLADDISYAVFSEESEYKKVDDLAKFLSKLVSEYQGDKNEQF